jgi:hypothetical protein
MPSPTPLLLVLLTLSTLTLAAPPVAVIGTEFQFVPGTSLNTRAIEAREMQRRLASPADIYFTAQEMAQRVVAREN